jgi:malate synthase
VAKVRDDKAREAAAGYDGSWVAHPDLVGVCLEEFDKVLDGRPNQKDKQRPDVSVTAAQLLDIAATPAECTEAGLRSDVDVGLRYLESWLRGNGAAGIHGLMEDVATAEISRSQVWQWLHGGVQLSGGPAVTTELVRRVIDEALADIRAEVGDEAYDGGRWKQAREVFEQVALGATDTTDGDGFVDFLTLRAYPLID